MSRRPAIGVLGGTFDPVHLGHLHVAERVGEAFAFPKVVLVPSGTPPHKPWRNITDAEHRLEMVRIAIRDRPWLGLDAQEIERRGTSFTIDTLDAMRAGPDAVDPVFVIGLDMLFEIDTWRDWERVLSEFDLIAVDRPGREVDAARTGLAAEVARRIVPAGEAAGPLGSGGRVFHLPIPPIPVSSREIRRRVADGMPVDDLVPPGVALYIWDHCLYRKEDRS